MNKLNLINIKEPFKSLQTQEWFVIKLIKILITNGCFKDVMKEMINFLQLR